MSQVLLSQVQELRVERASNGGWVVYALKGLFDEGPPMAACQDDEALLEWLAYQFGLSAPEIEPPRPATFQGLTQIPRRELNQLWKSAEPLEALVSRLNHLSYGVFLETDTTDLDGQRIVFSLDGLRALVRDVRTICEELPF